MGFMVFIWVLSSGLTYATEPFFVSLGSVQSYTVPYAEQNTLLLSRDGSYATKVQKGSRITKPGTYYLSQLESDTLKGITKFQIPYNMNQNEWRIDSEKELTEILKYTLENYKEKITIKFNKGSYTINQMNEVIYKVLDELMVTYPKVTYVSYKLTSYGNKAPKILLEFTYALPQIPTLKQYDKNTDQKIEQLIKQLIQPGMKDYEREWVLGDYLIKNLIYAKQETHLNHTMQGAITEGRAVCDGYAKSYMYLLNSIGIPTQFVTGVADNIPHAWNLVKLIDGYYHVDLTWADLEEDHIGNFYNYFNETDTYMELTHIWEKGHFPKAEGKKYLSIYSPIPREGIYKVSSQKEWQALKKQLGQDGLKEANIIFYNVGEERWSIESVLDSILKVEQAAITYSAYYKYDSLIINYKGH